MTASVTRGWVVRTPAALASVALMAACSPGTDAGSNPPIDASVPATASSASPSPSSSSSSSATPITDISGCVTSGDAELLLHEGSATTAVVALMGEGPVGVVVSYEQTGSVCPWLPLADRLVAEGYQVLLYDRRSGVPADYAPDLTALLRERGTNEVFLVGGSLGGTASLEAAAVIEPPVAGVVNLSGGRPDTVAVAAELAVPLLQIVAAGDNGGAFATTARLVDEAAVQAPEHELTVLPGSAHASGFFRAEQSEQVMDQIVGFLDSHRVG